jgi:hypothetical protein
MEEMTNVKVIVTITLVSIIIVTAFLVMAYLQDQITTKVALAQTTTTTTTPKSTTINTFSMNGAVSLSNIIYV